jgi:hypothetical protein
MTLITLPAGFEFDAEEWTFDVPGQLNRSIFTSRRKFIGLAGAETWACKLTVEAITTEIDERLWRAFLVKLKGQENPFNVKAACQSPPAGTPVVGTGSTNGYTLPITGMAHSATILTEGQFLTVPLPSGHKRLVCLTADLVSNGSGNGTATFGPALTEVPTSTTPVEMTNPYCPMNLKARSNGWNRVNGIAQFMLDAEEAL